MTEPETIVAKDIRTDGENVAIETEDGRIFVLVGVRLQGPGLTLGVESVAVIRPSDDAE